MKWMQRSTVMSVVIGFQAAPAFACFSPAAMDFRDIFMADIVVQGFVEKMDIVQSGRAYYGRFKINVIKAILGTPPSVLTVTWQNSTFELPKILNGSYVIALRHARSSQPPLRSGSGVVWETPEPEHPTVLQAPCSQPFIFEARSEQARAVTQVFDGEGDPGIKADVLAKFIGATGPLMPARPSSNAR